MEDHNVWKSKQPTQLDNEIIDFLNNGILYLIGRDHRFRPIMVMNMSKINTKIHKEEYL